MIYRLEISPRIGMDDPAGHTVQKKAKSILSYDLNKVETAEILTIDANFARKSAEEVLKEIVNPVLQQGVIGAFEERTFDWFISVGFLAGVTDNVSRTAREAIRDIIGRPLTEEEKVYSSREYFISSPNLKKTDIEHIAKDLLANELIQSVAIMSFEEWKHNGSPINVPEFVATEEPKVDFINIDVSDDELMDISNSKTLALQLDEMQAIRDYAINNNDPEREALGLKGKLTDAELECLAQSWSEHCSHKIFAADIEYTDAEGNVETINSLYKSYIKKSTFEIGEQVDWLVSVFHDNAGVITFNEKYDLAFKLETHNSPSALDPYGGAMTGIVGVNRDIMGTGTGAEMLVNVWGYCLGSPFVDSSEVPEGLLHPRRIRDGVHQGVIEGGNQSGIPYGLGWEYFDARYIGKPLVYCGTVGILPHKQHGKSASLKTIEPGDLIVMVGGRIGKDGIHGATFSSEELHKDSPVAAVQIGDPITQKKAADFLYEARDADLYRFVTDNGAGGLSSSIGEMATECNGCYVDLAKAPLKYAGLQPWEIFVSEAQERMSFAVPAEKVDAFLTLAGERDVEATVLGTFNDSGKCHLVYNELTVAFLDLDFMHGGNPKLQLKAKWDAPVFEEIPEEFESEISDDIHELLASLNLCSSEYKARQYDHEVKALSVVKPYVGVEADVDSDASVFMAEPMTQEGFVLSNGLAPSYSDIDTYHMTASIIDMCLRKIVAVGGSIEKVAGLDNFCWPDPVESAKTPDGQYKLAQLVRSNQALYDYCKAFMLPCISGKDSMKNDSTRGGKKISIPPTLLFSAIAPMKDISKSVTLSSKRAGDYVYVIGETFAELGGSQYASLKGYVGNKVPKVNADEAKKIYKQVHQATDAELVHSLHAPAFGGLAAAFARKSIAGRLGMEIDINSIPSDDLSETELLFSESNSRLVATVAPDKASEFEAALAGVSFAKVGVVTLDDELVIRQGKHIVAALNLENLVKSYKKTLDGV
ncbi:AIR synthase-related protein [Lentisphaera marina]|uniref:phosphoribosylformylglycinamidine synthase subunit PurL n=1 Tax=Lentisphaera marina TaxID=1111041 RepID=UPI002365E7E3|nr:AIR synthase-related protein [Lentisphaera marina]MDD7983480.1 AIR synthase-related protein [Lentisphaera marina]